MIRFSLQLEGGREGEREGEGEREREGGREREGERGGERVRGRREGGRARERERERGKEEEGGGEEKKKRKKRKTAKKMHGPKNLEARFFIIVPRRMASPDPTEGWKCASVIRTGTVTALFPLARPTRALGTCVK